MNSKNKSSYSFIQTRGIIHLSKKKQIIDLIRKENTDSILQNLTDKLLINYLDTIIKSKNVKLFTLIDKNQVLAYAIVALKPKYLIKDISKLSLAIAFDLIKSFSLICIVNIFLSLSKIDLLLLSNKNKKIIKENLNLNLLAVKASHQSKGLGKKFLTKIFNFYRNKKVKYLTCETSSRRAINFYKKKCGFKVIGKRFRVLNSQTILKIRIN